MEINEDEEMEEKLCLALLETIYQIYRSGDEACILVEESSK